MTDPLHVCLGKFGDLCISLPALKKWADQNGRPAALLTSEEFLPLFEGVSYVNARALPATFDDLSAVLAYLKTDLPAVEVKCLQFYQSRADKALPSFWHEQMYLAGLLGGGEDDPLVFDRRDETNEHILCAKHIYGDRHPWDKKPVILVALEGKSSPFKDSKLLMEAIVHAFPDCNVVDLSKIKAERIYDLLGLYDHAAALISIDTVHLHLSKASKVPVFALARDYPDRWHGTPQLNRFTWYCRYGQVMERVDELVQAIRDTLDGVEKPKPETLPLPKGAYNPSIIVHEGRELISYRHHPNRTWRTQIILDGLPVKFPYPVSTCAHEDMRLFEFKGELWASYVCSRGSRLEPKCITGYGQLVRMPEFWVIKEHFQPAMSDNDWSGMSKNYVGFEHGGRIHLIYNDQNVLTMSNDDRNNVQWCNSHEPAEWTWGMIRGGTSPLPYKGNWLRFFHSRIWPSRDEPWRYHIGALLMEPEPPFNVIQVSSKPILSGDESGDPMIWHYKPNCCLPYGVIEDGDGWIVSLGINDAHCAVLRLKEGDLNFEGSTVPFLDDRPVNYEPLDNLVKSFKPFEA